MRVCKHGCDVNMFCFLRTNHASTNLKKVLSWKISRQVYFIYLFPRRLKLEKSLETCCVKFFFAWADILSEKSILFGKQGLIKVPITKIFLFSYLKLYLIKITSAKKFCDLNKSRFFYNFLKTFKLAAILHTIRLSLLSEYDVIWRTLRNMWLYRR